MADERDARREIIDGVLEQGASEEGVVMFEIPEDATVQWGLLESTIFVGGNLDVVASECGHVRVNVETW